MNQEAQAALTNLTTILPNTTAKRVIDSVLTEVDYPAFVSTARGTLLHDHWIKRLFPPISPVKTIIEMLVPNHEIDAISNAIVKESRLDQQAIGAIFSTDYQHAHSDNLSPAKIVHGEIQSTQIDTESDRNLRLICCIVSHNLSDQVTKAAIDIGTHGPIIYYAEGRGLRDRLGWLRITKEHEKEVLMIITDEDDADEVFDALAKAGEFHMPGKGFMYSLPIKKGMFNLPSRISHHHHAASMQQIIHAIDQLSGHTHWRDQAIFDLGVDGRCSGFEFIKNTTTHLTEQECISVFTVQSNLQAVMDMMLDLKAPGVNFSFSRHINQSQQSTVNEEYVKIQSIVNAELSEQIYHELTSDSAAKQFSNLFCGTTSIPLVATYIPGKKDYRQSSRDAA